MKITSTLFLLFTFYFKLFAQVPGFWDFAADMGEVRNGHTATFINDTVLLVTGGFNGSENVRTAEVYNPVSDSWSNTGDMDSIRFQHTATALDNGKAIIAGGWDGGYLNYYGTQIYDPATHLFSAGPFMHTGRSGHTATKLQNGKVLFVGGYSNENGNTDIVDLYDPVTDTMIQVASLHYGRSYHCAVLLDDGRVLVAGGYNPDYGFQMSSVEIYDPEADTWTEAADMHTPRDYVGMANLSSTVISKKVLAVGGRFFNGSEYEGLKDSELYDIELDEWEEIEDMPEGQSYLEVIPFHWGIGGSSNYAVLIPGATDKSGSGVDLTFSGSFTYDFTEKEWLSVPMFEDGRYLYSAEEFFYPFYGGDVSLICGGFDKIVEYFVPASFMSVINQSQQTFSISPNPANSEIRVQLQNDQQAEAYTVFNVAGEKVNTGSISHQEQLSIPVTELHSGMYMLQLTLADGSLASAFFVKE